MDNNFNGFIGLPIQNGIQTTCGCQGGNMAIPDNNFNGTNLQRTLSNYLGRRVTCEFCSVCGNTRKTGILNGVGNDYLILTNNNGGCMLCDTENLKFISIRIKTIRRGKKSLFFSAFLYKKA